MTEEEPSVDALRDRRAGADEEDPYADRDPESLPAWWRRAAEEFDDHGLRPYRPPRFADGTPVHEVVEELEADLGATVSFGSVDTDYRERWEVRVDGAVVDTVGRRRSPAGYTVYETSGEAFAAAVREAVGGTGD
ncbi:MAG: hypothetical protein ABEJ04_03830 [Halobacteriaceae archaeon]